MKRFFTLSFFIFNFSFFISSQTTDRGFIHPGGLHTQADFDRVKAQLAAGNTKVKQAYAKLKAAAYAQPTVQTYPSETIVRGGGTGENYINAARGAAMAYQNGLRWKIEGNTSCADAAVRVLMAWANTTKAIGGDTNYALAAGLYGYAFAQAAELVRDYEGWSRDDFEQFKQWMLSVWYPSSLGFLRGRCGTWENGGKWWQAPGHYWSNWGLCNAICLASIGVLCDDVFIYNQAMSYFKYDQVGNYTNPPTMHEVTGHGDADGGQCIHNDGLTEFLGNLVVTTSQVQGSRFKVQDGDEVEVGGYGEIGQMNESGRDTGHSAMALGLAIDLAKIGWNQGDDLYAYMDHRLAAGIEYVAAQTQSAEGLPWTDYMYGTNGIYYSDGRAWLMKEPALGAQMRPYWGTVIGIYEGVKGVRMPFSEIAYNQMGIDEGAQGSTSGGYDHMGYSVLMNTRDEQLCPADKVPTELTPKMEYSGTLTTNLIPSLAKEKTRGLISGKTLMHNELGGLVNTYTTNINTCPPAGETLTLMPQLPDGEEDTGNWKWNTGETTRNITVTTDKSYIYRVTYTNKNGIESQLCFPIAAKADCTPDRLTPSITYNGETLSVGSANGETDVIDVLYGKSITLSVTPSVGWGAYKWSTGAGTQSISVSSIKKDQDVSVTFTNQGGATTTMVFHLHVLTAIPYYIKEDVTTEDNEIVLMQGDSVTLGLTTPTSVAAAKVSWSDGTTGSKTLLLKDLQTSGEYTASFVLSGETQTFVFKVYLIPSEATPIEAKNYLLRHVATDTYLTANGKSQLVTFEPRDEEGDSQLWTLKRTTATTPKYGFASLADADNLHLSSAAKLATSVSTPFYIDMASGTDRIAIHTGSSVSSRKYWDVAADGAVLTSAATKLTAVPFQLIPVGSEDGILQVNTETNRTSKGKLFDLSGRQIANKKLARGIYIVDGKKIIIK